MIVDIFTSALESRLNIHYTKSWAETCERIDRAVDAYGDIMDACTGGHYMCNLVDILSSVQDVTDELLPYSMPFSVTDNMTANNP